MNVYNFIVKIKCVRNSEIDCQVYDKDKQVKLIYSLGSETVLFEENNYISEILNTNLFQFGKVIRSAIKGKMKPDHTINCVFIEDFNFLNDKDYLKFIRMDRSRKKLKISTSESEMENIHKIYADGSFAGITKQSGYGGFIEDPYGNREVYSKSFKGGSSNLMEMLAVTEGLQKLKSIDQIQINTDSRFVIRGLIQWVHFWKHNNWQTAGDSDVKYVHEWKLMDKLCDGKIIEFNWVKGHSGNEEQDFCHNLAKETAALTNW